MATPTRPSGIRPLRELARLSDLRGPAPLLAVGRGGGALLHRLRGQHGAGQRRQPDRPGPLRTRLGNRHRHAADDRDLAGRRHTRLPQSRQEAGERCGLHGRGADRRIGPATPRLAPARCASDRRPADLRGGGPPRARGRRQGLGVDDLLPLGDGHLLLPLRGDNRADRRQGAHRPEGGEAGRDRGERQRDRDAKRAADLRGAAACADRPGRLSQAPPADRRFRRRDDRGPGHPLHCPRPLPVAIRLPGALGGVRCCLRAARPPAGRPAPAGGAHRSVKVRHASVQRA